MELRQSMTETLLNPDIKRTDRIIFKKLLSNSRLSAMQRSVAKRTLKRYGIKSEQKIQGRRATLRDGKLWCFGVLRKDEQEKWQRIPGSISREEKMSVPCNKHSIRILKELQYELSGSVSEWENEVENKPRNLEFDSRLFPYQKEGVLRIEELNGRVLLSDVMGLGKSCQACTYLFRNPEVTPALIICPSGLRLNWKKELIMWGVTDEITIIQTKKDSIPTKGIVIMSYDVASSYYCELEEVGFKVLIVDESHYLRNPESKRSKVLKYLSKGIDKIILISGTNITSRPKEFFGQLSMIAPEMFNSRVKFEQRYCNLMHDSTGKGASNTGELHSILAETYMIRRLKKDVLKDLPPRIYKAVPVTLNNTYRDEYEFAKKDVVAYVKENYGGQAANRARFGETMVRMNHLLQIAAKGKMEDAMEYIRNIVDSGEKVCIFATHKISIEKVMSEFGSIALKIDGSLSNKHKQANVERFQTDEDIKLIVCNIQAGGVGITLTASSNVVFLEYPWCPGDLSQAIARIDRIGQEASSINIHYIVSDNTIDQWVCELLDKKARVLADILDGGELDEEILLNQLIEKFKNM